ncbi:MAG: hypothetical protein VW405_18360 [Rhodospirillaceae bacterium]
MNRRRSSRLGMVVAVAALSGCASAPATWQPSLEGAGTTAVRHLECAGGELWSVAAGTLEGGLNGAGVGFVAAADLFNGQVDNEVGWSFLGGAIGLGAGLGDGLLNLPKTYGNCLDAAGAGEKPAGLRPTQS